MMNADILLSTIENTRKAFKEIILTANFERKGSIISWSNYNSGIEDDFYLFNYDSVLKRRQYSFLLIDSSIVQLFYQFNDDNELLKYKLAYYSNPQIEEYNTEDVEDYYDEGVNDLIKEHLIELFSSLEKGMVISKTNQIRFDYVADEPNHCKSHLQIGGMNDLRIHSKSLILPFHLFEIIASCFFKKEYAVIKKKQTYTVAKALTQKFPLIIEDLGPDYEQIHIVRNK